MRALYLAAGVTDIYAETGDEALLASMLRQWDDLASAKSYLTGGIGSRHYGEVIGNAYELPPDRAYCETCASIASMMWNWRMLLVTGESRFADLFERTLYNGFLSGLSLDGESFFYANPLQSRTGDTDSAESGCLLPAEHHAAAPIAVPLPRDRDGPRDPATSVRLLDDPRRRRGPQRGDRIPLGRDGQGRSGREPRSRVDARPPHPGLGARGDPRRRSRRRGGYAEVRRRWRMAHRSCSYSNPRLG